MQYELIGGNTFPILKFHLDQGESIKAESGAMVGMSTGLTLKGKVDGGVKRAIGRMFTGESFFMQHITAEKADGWTMLATPAPGGITPIELDGSTEWTVQKNGFLAGTTDVDVTTKMQSLTKGLLSGEGFFVIRIGGTGTVFLSSYGVIVPIDVPEGEKVRIDNGHLVAWQADMQYKITKGGSSWFSSVTSGEGFACDFQGPGRVYIQTRNPNDFGFWLAPFIPFPQG